MKIKTVHSSTRIIRVSPRKLNLVARLVRNMTPVEAMRQMQFCNKKAAKHVFDSIKSAVAGAENTHNMRISDLIITNASVGKAACMKRFRARAKGRSASIKKFFSSLYLSLSIVSKDK